MATRIVFFDCDGTLTTVKSSWQYLHERLDLWDENADEFQRLFRAGKIDYEEFCRRDAALWKGLPEAQVRGLIDEIPYHEGVKETVRGLKAAGITTVILSTGLEFLVKRAQAELGIDIAVANALSVDDGVITGGIRINVEHDRKGYWVKKILGERGLTKQEAAAVGDGEGDQGMFEEVGLSIGYHPSPKVRPLLDHAFDNGSFQEILKVIEARP
jgi:phosphoserine phosphatase